MASSQTNRTLTSNGSYRRISSMTTCVIFFAGMFVCTESYPVKHTTSVAVKYLRRMHFNIETALNDHLTANLCESKKNCTVLNPSLEIKILPKCQMSGLSWYNLTRINYSGLHTYQGYLSAYLRMSESKSLLSSKTRHVLEDEMFGAGKALVFHMPDEVKCRTGQELNEGTFSEEISKISNKVLAKARLYVFLHQYKDFLSCFKNAYRKHFPSTRSSRCLH